MTPAFTSYPLNEAEAEMLRLASSLHRLDDHFMQAAWSLSENAVCVRRKVGCIVQDVTGDVLGVGWNQQPASRGHCSPGRACPGGQIVGMSAGDKCEAIHAEIAALMSCPDTDKIYQCVVTSSPCMQCVRALLLTPCQRIVFDVYWPNPQAQEWWEGAGREWRHISKKLGEYPKEGVR